MYAEDAKILGHMSASVCYEELGCFTNDPPFYDPPHRPLSYLPEDPSHIDTGFTMYSRLNPTVGHVLSAYDQSTVMSSFYNPALPTKIIIHGYLEYGDTLWMHQTKDEFLKAEDCQVILTNWLKGALAGYTKSTANTEVVGAEIALLMERMKEWASLKLDDVHLIGFSLGAHVAGYAGERLNQLGRITGLDPAEPYFKETHPIVRLDPRDAKFVDIIHTDAEALITWGFGIREAIGHVDFYPNGGHVQPGCDQGVVDRVDFDDGLYEGGKDFVACNHFRATHFFNVSINFPSPLFQAYPCPDEESFDDGKCMSCGTDGCSYMGFYSTENMPATGVEQVTYFLKTQDDYPYYTNHYHIQLVLGSDRKAEDQPAELYITLFGDNDKTEEKTLIEKAEKLKHENTYMFVVDTGKDLGPLESIHFRWVHDASLLHPGEWDVFKDPYLFVDQIIVTNLEDENEYYFCGENKPVDTDVTTAYYSESSC
ncbi:inactive pancreatic lipase-related protein 1-like [Glandiceps talaboti]